MSQTSETTCQERAYLKVASSVDIILHLLCCLGLVRQSARKCLSNMLPAACYPLHLLFHLGDLSQKRLQAANGLCAWTGDTDVLVLTSLCAKA